MPAVAPLASWVRKMDSWAFLNNEERDAMLALPYTLKTIEAHHYIVREGDKPTQSCVMISGLSYRHKVTANGARQILSIHMSGDIVDLQNSLLGIADHNVQILTASQVAFIPREAIVELAFERPAIGKALWYDTLVDGSIFREWITNVGRRDARTRLAHLLCEYALRLEAAGLGSHREWELPMSQEQLADCTGLTPVHVNRMLKSLANEGLIRRTRRSVTINDWKSLAAAADFDSGYLHLPPEKLALAQ